LLPITLLFIVFIIGGIIQIAVESLGYLPGLGLDKISFKSYMTLFKDPYYYGSIIYALYLAFVSSFISAVVGTILAYRLVQSKHPFIKKLLKNILSLGLILPYLYMTFISLLVLSRTGIISRILYQTGLIDSVDSFPQFFYGPTGFGIILIFSLKGIFFVTLFVLNVMGKVKSDYQHIASSLGASPMETLRYIYLPLSRNSIIWSTLIIFIYDLGAFEVPYLFSGQKMSPLSVLIYRSYLEPSISSIPITMAMNMVLFILSLLSVLIYGKFLKKVIVCLQN
jgi:putative spermidine/putrescine transport system permease protein